MSTTDPCPHGYVRGACVYCDPQPGAVWCSPHWLSELKPAPRPVVELPAVPLIGQALEVPRRVYGVPPSRDVRADMVAIQALRISRRPL